MEQYIKKSDILPEIKKRYEYWKEKEFNSHSIESEIRMSECQHLMLLLNNLKVKEVNLKEEIKNRIDSLSNLYCYMEDLFNGNDNEGVYPIPEKVTNELVEFAKYFFELGLTQKEE